MNPVASAGIGILSMAVGFGSIFVGARMGVSPRVSWRGRLYMALALIGIGALLVFFLVPHYFGATSTTSIMLALIGMVPLMGGSASLIVLALQWAQRTGASAVAGPGGGAATVPRWVVPGAVALHDGMMVRVLQWRALDPTAGLFLVEVEPAYGGKANWVGLDEVRPVGDSD